MSARVHPEVKFSVVERAAELEHWAVRFWRDDLAQFIQFLSASFFHLNNGHNKVYLPSGCEDSMSSIIHSSSQHTEAPVFISFLPPGPFLEG